MGDVRRFTAIIEREQDGYVALCPEYDIASEGATIEEARTNLVEALTLFFECAESTEKERRYRPEVLVTQVEVKVARLRRFSGEAVGAVGTKCVGMSADAAGRSACATSAARFACGRLRAG